MKVTIVLCVLGDRLPFFAEGMQHSVALSFRVGYQARVHKPTFLLPISAQISF
ncbi:hypothetical protein Cflav_PD5704 [Pedosphaera parvula Ellin514]|uniref:Uncharacterized protein n=1 Tax=Pedosphaera parvula (strain Ellin514) TaxID=320771 RepID=B9XAN4_PEDPL|nr:hypothetical protein Cflav_PD5704 [Pedosphaera parvula Ellin514]